MSKPKTGDEDTEMSIEHRKTYTAVTTKNQNSNRTSEISRNVTERSTIKTESNKAQKPIISTAVGKSSALVQRYSKTYPGISTPINTRDHTAPAKYYEAPKGPTKPTALNRSINIAVETPTSGNTRDYAAPANNLKRSKTPTKPDAPLIAPINPVEDNPTNTRCYDAHEKDYKTSKGPTKPTALNTIRNMVAETSTSGTNRDYVATARNHKISKGPTNTDAFLIPIINPEVNNHSTRASRSLENKMRAAQSTEGQTRDEQSNEVNRA